MRTKTCDVFFDGAKLSVVRLADGADLGTANIPDAETATAASRLLSGEPETKELTEPKPKKTKKTTK